MILDTGICSIYSVANTAAPGNMPMNGVTLKYQSWYGELNFETVPKNSNMQEVVEISARIRVVQNRSVSNHDVAILSSGPIQYEITRAFHGIDEENGQLITDLTLVEVVNVYDLA